MQKESKRGREEKKREHLAEMLLWDRELGWPGSLWGMGLAAFSNKPTQDRGVGVLGCQPSDLIFVNYHESSRQGRAECSLALWPVPTVAAQEDIQGHPPTPAHPSPTTRAGLVTGSAISSV